MSHHVTGARISDVKSSRTTSTRALEQLWNSHRILEWPGTWRFWLAKLSFNLTLPHLSFKAAVPIARNTLIEISPVLLFPKTEYENYGKYTLLDHYTFVWPGGFMALALGLGTNLSDLSHTAA